MKNQTKQEKVEMRHFEIINTNANDEVTWRCGHRHQSIETAVKCLDKASKPDQIGGVPMVGYFGWIGCFENGELQTDTKTTIAVDEEIESIRYAEHQSK